MCCSGRRIYRPASGLQVCIIWSCSDLVIGPREAFQKLRHDRNKQGFTCTPYTPSIPKSNGTVESVCKEVLRSTRALLSEFLLKPNEWPRVLCIVQSILNHSKRRSLGDRAPVTVFTGLLADNPLRTLLPEGVPEDRELTLVKAQQKINSDKLIEAMDGMHREVNKTRTRNRQRAIEKNNESNRVHAAQFDVGDFVLVARKEATEGSKLRLKWIGPRRVTRALSEHSYEVQNILN